MGLIDAVQVLQLSHGRYLQRATTDGFIFVEIRKIDHGEGDAGFADDAARIRCIEKLHLLFCGMSHRFQKTALARVFS
jgi:hypothetical protein